MVNETRSRTLLHGIAHDFRSCWKPLVLTDIAFKLMAFIVLTPVAALLFRLLIALSGSEILSDLDILMFLVRPAGWIAFIFAAAIWLGIVAFEQAALTGIVCAQAANRRLGILGALRFAAGNAWSVIQVTARIAAWTLLASVPFLAVAAVIYFTLLTEYDINYYLNEKPPVFGVAIGLGVLLVTGLAVTIFRLFTGWCFSLPLVLFERIPPSQALRRSEKRADGHRLTVLGWMVGWILATFSVSFVASGVVAAGGRFVISFLTDSFHLLTIATGVVLLLWAVVMAGANLLSTTTFAVMLFGLYRQLGSDGNVETSQLGRLMKRSTDDRLGITPTRLTAAAGVGFAVAVVVGVLAVRNVRVEDRVEIIAHRGASDAAPENTMAAIRGAIDDGADWVEIDVQETADGNVVVFHDSDFMKVAGVDLKIWDATTDDLKDIDIGGWFAPEFANQRVPTLAEVLDECKGKIGVNIELKYYGHEKQLEERVVKIVESRGMASEIVLMSLKMEGVRKLKSLRPDWGVGLLMSVAAGNLSKIKADFVAVNAKFATPAFVRSVQRAEKELYVWTVNDASSMSRMISRGVDGLITDKPRLARRVLERRAEMSGLQRLLLELAGVIGADSESDEIEVRSGPSGKSASVRSADGAG